MIECGSDVATELSQSGGGIMTATATEEDELGYVDAARAGLNPRHPPLRLAKFGGQLPLREIGVLAHLPQQGRDFSVTQGVIGFGSHDGHYGGKVYLRRFAHRDTMTQHMCDIGMEWSGNGIKGDGRMNRGRLRNSTLKRRK